MFPHITVIMYADSGARDIGSVSLELSAANCENWTNFLTFLCFDVLTCEMGVMIEPASRDTTGLFYTVAWLVGKCTIWRDGH